MYFNILLKYTDGFHSQDTKNLGMKNSQERNPILVIVYLSIPTDGPTYVSEEEKAQKIKTGRKKATASRAVQCRMLGFSTPYEVTDSTGLTVVWVKNAFTCYNLESKNIMCRHHDCFWNCSTPGALSDAIANTSNDTDLVATSEEEFDYTLIGMDTQRTTNHPIRIDRQWWRSDKDPK
jgi:hypothetical protein